MPTKEIKKQIQKKAMETTMKLMADDRTRPYVARAMQHYMTGRQRFNDTRAESLQQLGVMTGEEFSALKSRTRRIDKRVQKLAARLAEIEASI